MIFGILTHDGEGAARESTHRFATSVIVICTFYSKEPYIHQESVGFS